MIKTNLFAFDTETVGFSDKIVQMSFQQVVGPKQFNRYILTDNDDEMAIVAEFNPQLADIIKQQGIDEEQAVEELVNWLDKIDEKPISLLCHNAVFDIPRLRLLLKKYAIEYDDYIYHRTRDTQTTAIFLSDIEQSDSHCSLNYCSKKFGVAVDDSKFHDAIYDAQITAKLYLKMLEYSQCP